MATDLRRHVAGVPVVLMARVEDEAEVGGLEGADQRAAVHDLGDAFQALRDFDVVDGGVDGGEGAEDAFGADAGLEGGVAFGVEGFGLRHAAGHPEDDDGVGCGGRGSARRRSEEFGSAPASAASGPAAVTLRNVSAGSLDRVGTPVS